MSDARTAIFAKINAVDANRRRADPAQAQARLDAPVGQPLPAIATPKAADRQEVFIAKALELGCTVADAAGMDAVPAAIAAYLTQHDAPLEVVLAPDDDFADLGWLAAGLTTTSDAAKHALDGASSVTRARAGVAETGAVAVASSARYATGLGLLPDRHIIVLHTDEIVGGYEDVWQIARSARDNQGMSRALIFIGGPSRTADIEATLVMGAHGPRAVHLILVA